MIDRQTIERIFDAIDIVEVISDFVSLKKTGQNYKGFSPWTNEKTPSFFVSPSKGIFKDFSSGKGGNAVGFLMEHEKLTYPEALRWLAKKFNIEIVEQEPTAEEIQIQNERESLLVINTFAQKYFTSNLYDQQEGQSVALTYFKERGIRESTIKKFQLGYSLEQKDAFTREAKKKGFKPDLLEKTGLTIQRENNAFDRFNGRIMFPIHGLSGNIIGFGGRTLRSDDKTAKYLNSPESEIYQKSKVLYGLYSARQSVAKLDKCFLVEGYIDVLSMHQAGIENVVASSGTSLTVEQLRLIKRFTSNITIIYDGDEAGIKASLRGIDLVLEEGLNLRVVLLPDREDPDSYSRKLSSKEFIDFIKKEEKDFISFKTQLLSGEAEHDPVKKANLINDVIRSISVIPDTVTRSVYIKECSKILSTEERILYSQVYQLRRKRAEDKYIQHAREEKIRFQSTPIPAFVSEVYNEPQEKILIRFLLMYGNEKLFESDEEQTGSEYISVAEYITNEILNDELEFNNLLYRQIFEEVHECIKRGEVIDIKYFVNHSNSQISKIAVDLLSFPYELSKLHKRKGANVETEEMLLKKNIPKAIIEYKRKILETVQKEKEEEIRKAQQDSAPEEQISKIMKQYITISSIITVMSKEKGWVVLK